MSKLQAIQIDADTIIYIEAAEDLAVPNVVGTGEIDGEVRRGGQKGGVFNPADQMAQSFKAIESTIKTYTKYCYRYSRLQYQDHCRMCFPRSPYAPDGQHSNAPITFSGTSSRSSRRILI
jgi:hypothetical protein